jgi:hypothetical protein
MKAELRAVSGIVGEMLIENRIDERVEISGAPGGGKGADGEAKEQQCYGGQSNHSYPHLIGKPKWKFVAE